MRSVKTKNKHRHSTLYLAHTDVVLRGSRGSAPLLNFRGSAYPFNAALFKIFLKFSALLKIYKLNSIFVDNKMW